MDGQPVWIVYIEVIPSFFVYSNEQAALECVKGFYLDKPDEYEAGLERWIWSHWLLRRVMIRERVIQNEYEG